MVAQFLVGRNSNLRSFTQKHGLSCLLTLSRKLSLYRSYTSVQPSRIFGLGGYSLVTLPILQQADKHVIHSKMVSSSDQQKWNEAGENVVVLHQFKRATKCPSFSPYCLKLETYVIF